ncbi:MAG: M28 family peptidase [Candidatus Saccharicenans sp.]|uniref:M28 family peptidase n=1 Tax=Candidatus Saccharicenans sp. TaxID=2819258 RepID=UPI00404A3D0D
MTKFGVKSRVWLLLPVVLFFCLSLVPNRAQVEPAPLRLVLVPKNQPRLEAMLSREKAECLQELQDSYILRLDREEGLRLRSYGLNFRLLTVYDRSLVYAMARAGRAADLELIRSRFRVIFLEGNDYLLLARDPAELEELPPTVRRRLLPATGHTVTGAIMLPEEFIWQRAQDQLYEQLAAEVSADNLRRGVVDLQNFGTRYAPTGNCLQAGQYIYDYFVSLGLPVSYQEFYYSTYLCRNVIAEVTGQTYPEQVVIICAHYDSTSDQRWTLAPGADDNASGTSAVLEAARIVASRPLDFTVRFILFSAEEQGLIGSLRYVQEKLDPAENILGVINLDMVAYADYLPEDLDVIGNRSSGWLVDRLAALSVTYGPVQGKKIIDASFVYSDHAPFWDRGISAICAIEDASVPNPYYHKTTDTVDTLNFDFYRAAARGCLISLVDLAQVIRPGYPATPRNFNLSLSTQASIFNHLKTVHLSWDPVPGAAGYNVYRGSVPHANFQRINSSLVQDNQYIDSLLGTEAVFYYTVTAVDSLNRESNFSRELAVNAGLTSLSTIRYLLWNVFNLFWN